jgi:ABC-type amino acid transport substrate-binding protein
MNSLLMSKRLVGAALIAFFVSINSTQANECVSFSGNGINNWYPFSYRSSDGQLTGVIVDGMHEALKRVGLKLSIQDDRPWKRIMYDLENDHVDMVLGAYWNSERSKKYIYSAQMGTDELRVFVKKGNEFSFNSFKDLIGRSGMHLLGGSLGDEFDEFSKNYLDLSEIPKSDVIVTMLHKERADYGILGYVEGLKFIHSLGLVDQITALPTPILSNGMFTLVSRNAHCAHKMEEVNKVIDEMTSDGTLNSIMEHHLKLIETYAQ